MFSPLYPAHSISELIFFFEFPGLSPRLIDNLISNHVNVAADLPAREALQGVHFDGGPSGFQAVPLTGEEWKRFRPDGTPEWVARVLPDAISVHCLAYDNWTDVWTKAERIIKGILAGVDFSGITPQSIGLRYLDRFVRPPNAGDFDLAELFKLGNPYVPAHVMGLTANMWHAHCGWIEAMGDRPMLSALNIDALAPQGQDEIVSILHTEVLRQQDGVDLNEFDPMSNSDNYSKFINFARDRNHTLLRDLLSTSILERIGLA